MDDFMFHDFIAGGPEYTMFFSHPQDFTPVCTTELGRCELLVNEFLARGVQLIGVSCDSVDSHLQWTTDILAREQIVRENGQLSFPIIADSSREIVTSLGMLDPEEISDAGIPLPARALMVIDQAKKVKLAIVYPATTGRNFQELIRVVDSLKLTKDLSLATPADWQQGDRCIVAPNISSEAASAKFEDLIIEDLPSGKQYLRHVKCPTVAQAPDQVDVSVACGAGFSDNPQDGDAVLEAVQSAINSGQIRAPAICFASCTVDRDVSEVAAFFTQYLPGVPIHGLTSSGSVLRPAGAVANGVGCLLVEAQPGSFASAFSEDVMEVVSLLKEQMPQPQAIIMSTVPGSEESVIDAINRTFEAAVPVYGGTAADNDLKNQWSVFGAAGCSSCGISLIGVGQNIRFGASMLGPYAPTEDRATITKCEGRRAYEINGAPAADWVYGWLGEEVQDAYINGGLILPQTAQRPIGFRLPSGEYVSAHLAGLGGAEKYVDFFAPVMEGDEMVIMDSGNGPATGYMQALSDAFDIAMESGGLSTPQGGLLIYCGGMAIAVGDQLNYGLVNGLQSRVGDLPVLGVTCFGEQAYLPSDQASVQRNLSLGLLLFE
jgi:1-Cys peroxiredoxin 6